MRIHTHQSFQLLLTDSLRRPGWLTAYRKCSTSLTRPHIDRESTALVPMNGPDQILLDNDDITLARRRRRRRHRPLKVPRDRRHFLRTSLRKYFIPLGGQNFSRFLLIYFTRISVLFNESRFIEANPIHFYKAHGLLRREKSTGTL